jgi:RNA polymerase sigma-70 factor (ECF subfamily)
MLPDHGPTTSPISNGRGAKRDSPESTSTSLLERAKGRDQEAWCILVDLYGPLLYHWCRRWGLSSDDAHDVVQEVFRAVATGMAKYRRDRSDATFRGWLWTIARHEAHRYVARRRNRPMAIGGSDLLSILAQIPQQPPHEDSDPETAGQLSGLIDRALRVIRRDFHERTWQAFWCTAVEGESAIDVARALGMTSRAVRQAKHRVVRRLREEFRDLID